MSGKNLETALEAAERECSATGSRIRAIGVIRTIERLGLADMAWEIEATREGGYTFTCETPKRHVEVDVIHKHTEVYTENLLTGASYLVRRKQGAGRDDAFERALLTLVPGAEPPPDRAPRKVRPRTLVPPA